jgi:hypothetical protein
LFGNANVLGCGLFGFLYAIRSARFLGDLAGAEDLHPKGKAVTVPSHHSMVGSCSGTVTMATWLETAVNLTTTPVPVQGPLTVTDGGPKWVFSGWYG